MKSILIVGMHEDKYIDRNARRLQEYSIRSGMDSARVDYPGLLKGNFPKTTAGRILVAFFFPHKFWDEHCEMPSDTGLYGTSRKSYDAFRGFWPEVEASINKEYRGRDISYLISPHNCFVDRDKTETIRLLAEKGVPVTEVIETRDIEDIVAQVSDEKGVFIKCRYGAEGKGITLLTKEAWLTNYRVESGRLCNNGNHGKWDFTEITGRKDLLAQLLANEVIVERELVTPEIEPGTKFDMRVYVVDKEVPHMFVRINNKGKVITNFSQGARVEHDYTKVLGKRQIAQAKDAATAAASALDARFIGIDCMFNSEQIAVVEAQMFTDFPDVGRFNMAEYLARLLKVGNL